MDAVLILRSMTLEQTMEQLFFLFIHPQSLPNRSYKDKVIMFACMLTDVFSPDYVVLPQTIAMK
jgi:hypothetical protein